MLRMSTTCVLFFLSLLCYVATAEPGPCKAKGKDLVGVPLERLYDLADSKKGRFRCSNPDNFQINGQLDSGPVECECPKDTVCTVSKAILSDEDSQDPAFDMEGFVCRSKAKVEENNKKLKDFSSGLNLGGDSDPARNDADKR